jgi:hypothetical protein
MVTPKPFISTGVSLHMKKITLVTGLALVLVVPTVAGAKPTPNAGDKRAAKTECKALRGNTDATREAFLTKFRNFGACVTKKAVEEAVEAQQAHKNAAWECKTQRSGDPTGFAEDWGTPGQNGANQNGRNAFGKCVSSTAKEKEQEADAEDQENATEFKNAAKACADERSNPPGEEAFNAKWGENESDANAFGKCVSRTVRGLGPAQPAAPTS